MSWGEGGALWNLINVVQLEVLEEQQQQSRDGLDDDLFVAVDVDPQLHALEDRDTEEHTNTRTCCEPFSCLIFTGLITPTHQGAKETKEHKTSQGIKYKQQLCFLLTASPRAAHQPGC